VFDSILDHLQRVFGSDEPERPLVLGQILVRAAGVYLGGLLLVRLGKSRLLSKATPLDVMLVILLGSLLSRGITGAASLSGTMVASVTLVSLHYLMTWLTWDQHWLGKILKGQAHQIVKDGEMDLESMRRSHISENDLLTHMRLSAHIDDVTQVKAAYKERNGDISFVLGKRQPRVIELPVEDGVTVIRIEFTNP
jgi:uncharacterized membrane protein YcaP (DUF421 family)